MCLQGIIKASHVPQSEVRKAFKLVDGNQTPFKNASLCVGLWMYRNASWNGNKNLSTEYFGKHGESGSYSIGYHTYPTRQEARKALKYFKTSAIVENRSTWKLVKVEVKGITTEGYDGSSNTSQFLDMKLRNYVSNYIKVTSLEAQ